MKVVKWYDFARYCQMWVEFDPKGDEPANLEGIVRFDGLKSTDFNKISEYFSTSTNVKMQRGVLGTKGINCANISIRDQCIEVHDPDGQLMSVLPLSSIASATIPGRGEIDVQFAVDDTADALDESIVEFRAYVPPSAKLNGVPGGEEDDEETANKVGALQAAIIQKAGVREGAGEPLVEIPEEVGSFLVPRGRFQIDMHPSFMRLQGTSFEFRVAYKSITRFTYLPLPSSSGTWADARRYAIVITLDDPIRQGNQRHPHLVLQLDKKHYEIALNIPEEDRKAGRYEGLDSEGAGALRGELPKLIGNLFKKIAGKPVYKPETFESASQQRAIRCTHKSATGLLFPLEKTIMFIHKPTILLKYSDIEIADIQRGESAMASRSFDLSFTLRGGVSDGHKTVVFSSIDRSERSKIEEFLRSRGVTVNSPISEQAAQVMLDEEDSETDESFSSGDESSDDNDSEESASDSDSDAGSSGKRKRKRDD